MEFSRVCFLFVSFSLLSLARGQQSPCPKYFEYRIDEDGIHGIVHVYPTDVIPTIHLKVNFTVATRLSSNYLGKLLPQGETMALIQQYQRGVPIDFRVYFPVTSPLPKITSIVINDNVVCTGPADLLMVKQYVTNVGLQHSLYLSNSHNWNYYFSNVSYVNNGSTNSKSQFHFVKNNYEIKESPKPSIPNLNIFGNEQSLIYNQAQQSLYNKVQQPLLNNNNNNNKGLTAGQELLQPLPFQNTNDAPTESLQQASSTKDRDCGVNGNDDKFQLDYTSSAFNHGNWPWLVAVFTRKEVAIIYLCAGTLVSDIHIISAAHCRYTKSSIIPYSDIVVKGGVHDLRYWDVDENSVTRRAANVKEHESFNPTTFANNIMLITVTKAFEFNTYIKPACLWTGNADLGFIEGTSGVVVGWGLNSKGQAVLSEPRMVRLPVVKTSTCGVSKSNPFLATSSKTLCAGDRKEIGLCVVGPGGGFFFKDNGRWKLRGIVSVSIPPKKEDFCSVNDYIAFTDIAQYLPWISTNLKG